MLEREEVDGVIVCIGPEMHARLALDLLKRGIPVYTEKPPAASAQQALEVARAAKASGTLCMTAFKKRYAAAANRAKEWLAAFDADDLYSVSIDYASGGYANDSLRTSFLFDFAIHIIDLVSYLFGDADEVCAFSKGPNAFAVSIRFANGAVGSLNLTDGRAFHLPTEEVELTARGGNAMTIHNSSCWRIAREGKPVEWREPPTFISAGDSGRETGHLTEIEAFVQALRDGGPTRSDIYESYKSMVLLEAIGESAETGRVVKVRYQVA
jgi:predicted dehydrogenase